MSTESKKAQPKNLNVSATLTRANSHAKNGQFTEARQLYHSILKAFPQNQQARKALITLEGRPLKTNQPALAETQIDSVTALYANGQIQQALDVLDILIKQYPKEASLFNMSGTYYASLGQLESAVKRYKQALAINSNYAEAYYNLGIVLKNLGQREAAIKRYKQALAITPDCPEAYNNLGIVLHELGQLEAAVKYYEQALAIKPDYVEVHVNLGNAHLSLGHLELVVKCYEQALALKPDYTGMLHLTKLHRQSHLCDWRLWAEFRKIKDTINLNGKHVSPFTLLSLEDVPEYHQKRSEHYARETFRQTVLPLPTKPRQKPSKLRIAYFSADFYDHATMHLMAKLFKVHDKTNFEIFVYSYGTSRQDLIRDALMNDVDCFRDVKDQSDNEIVALARQDGIAIAIDLKGYTQGTRTGIFAFRLAPIQINYLGYPGTLGATFIDYIIADEVVIPPEQRQYYSEKIIYLPHSYQVNDNTREISPKTRSRAEYGLPEEAFVFCCFNNNYKISPQEFDIWMRLLDRVKGSVLWLLRSNNWAVMNLRKESEKRGINPERLIFADKMSQDEHLSRHKLADLFLDTFNVNAHTTASDALWAGLPVVTKQGQGFAARVAASLLTAVGLPELITKTEEDYEALIFDLATDNIQLKAIKDKLAKNRHTQPLFNTELFVRHLEDGYQQAYQRYFEAKKPKMIRVMALASDRIIMQENSRLSATVISTASAFRKGDITTGHARLTELLGMLGSDSGKLSQDRVLTLKAFLSEALTCLKNKDYLGLADILETNINPLLIIPTTGINGK